MHEAGSSSEFGTDFDTHVGAGSAAPSGPGPDAARSAHLGAHVEAECGAECDADGGPDAGTAGGADAGPAGGSDAGPAGGSDAGPAGGPDGDAGAGHGIVYGVVHRAKSGAVLRPMPAAPSPVVPAQRGVRDAARGEVLLRHARLASSGRPVFCTPSRAELAGVVSPRAGRGTDGKVIYPTREAAEAAARELEALGARSLRAYRCSRSRRGHFHLTTDSTPRSHLPLHLRIPQQRLSA
jgi:hypothetical protein